jgi:transposase
MKKETAIELLGGTVTEAAQAIGISYHAVYRWPDVLTPRISDRVQAALARMREAKKRSKKQAPQVSPVSVS